MTEPKRIQRKRTKGWKMPPNTVYVGRPSMWGNPCLLLGKDAAARQAAVDRFKQLCEREEILSHVYERWLTWRGDDYWTMEDWLKPIRGKNLACWCPLDQPCHADVLLEIAND